LGLGSRVGVGVGVRAAAARRAKARAWCRSAPAVCSRACGGFEVRDGVELSVRVRVRVRV
jgi:hypothetical protein